MENFHRSMPHVFKHEGGWSDHPADPGGATNRGITLAVYRDWRKDRHTTKEDLRRLSEDEAREIYLERYWKLCKAAELPHGVDLMHFDMAVNSGVGRAARLLQEVLGVPIDGIIGPQTIAAANAAEPRKLIDDLRARHEKFYRSLKTFPTFGRGWMSRLEARQKEAHAIFVENSPTSVA